MGRGKEQAEQLETMLILLRVLALWKSGRKPKHLQSYCVQAELRKKEKENPSLR